MTSSKSISNLLPISACLLILTLPFLSYALPHQHSRIGPSLHNVATQALPRCSAHPRLQRGVEFPVEIEETKPELAQTTSVSYPSYSETADITTWQYIAIGTFLLVLVALLYQLSRRVHRRIRDYRNHLWMRGYVIGRRHGLQALSRDSRPSRQRDDVDQIAPELLAMASVVVNGTPMQAGHGEPEGDHDPYDLGVLTAWFEHES